MFMKWTMKEINYLRNNSYYDCVLELSNHSEKAIKLKIRELGINKMGILSLDIDRYFDENRINILKKYYNQVSIDELKIKLDIDCNNEIIYKKANRLGLSKKIMDKTTLWAIKEYIINTYPNSNIKELSETVGVERKNIYGIITRLKNKGIIKGNIKKETKINRILVNWYFSN